MAYPDLFYSPDATGVSPAQHLFESIMFASHRTYKNEKFISNRACHRTVLWILAQQSIFLDKKSRGAHPAGLEFFFNHMFQPLTQQNNLSLAAKELFIQFAEEHINW